MNIMSYISIFSKVFSVIGLIALLYLMFAFVKNVSYSKYLTREDIDEIYSYDWTDDEFEALNTLLMDRKTIMKLIVIFLLGIMCTNLVYLGTNSARIKKTEDVKEILQIMYCNNPSEIDLKLSNKSHLMSKRVLDNLKASNIDNYTFRYAPISNSQNEIRVINYINTGNDKYIEYQITNNNVTLSNRRLHVRYNDNKISLFEEYVLIPADNEVLSSGESSLDYLEQERIDNLEENLGITDNREDNIQNDNRIPTESDNLSLDDIKDNK